MVALLFVGLVGLVAAAQQPQAYYDRIVYLTSTGIFHRKDCNDISGRETRAIRVGDLPSDAAECPNCKPLDASRDPVPVVKDLGLLFVVGSPTVIRSGATATSPKLATAQPLEILEVQQVTAGWLKIRAHIQKQDVDGWIAAGAKDVEGLVAGTVFDMYVRIITLEKQAWPVAVKVDILRNRIRIGFTGDQVALAVGKPLRRTTVETAKGLTETWFYPTQSVIFTLGKVSSIVTTEMP